MNEFYEFDERILSEKRWVWKYIAVALIFLLLGAIGMYYISQNFKS